ncbi:hypothetical protein, partial [Acidisphaera rubrifaciens]|uniref:hypothetical protein n=1 Tax=Acidisphaera rubrifaciens TaxID=50715 RepID=UPI00066237A5
MAEPVAAIRTARDATGVTIVFIGRLDAAGAARVWAPAMAAARQAAPGERLTFDLHGVSACDTAGAA